MVYKFKNASVNQGFNYVFERTIPAHTEIIIKMPVVTANKRGINDIAWQTDKDDVKLYGTLSANPGGNYAMWDLIEPNSEINKAVSGLKVVTGASESRVVIRAILN